MIRVLIADDHSIFRHGLRRVLGLASDISVVAEASSGDEVLHLIGRDSFNLMILDLSMAPPSGIDLIRRVRSLQPALPILILSVHDEGELAAIAMQSGARGYLTKDRDPEELLAAVRIVARGGRVLSPNIGDKLVGYGEVHAGMPHLRLTRREWQVFSLFIHGTSVGDIARELQVSRKTVSTYKQRLMEKLGIDSEASLVRYALRHGLCT